jgi:hypothetical protein
VGNFPAAAVAVTPADGRFLLLDSDLPEVKPDYGHHAQSGLNLNPAPFTTTFCVDFPFADFTPGIAGDTPDFPNKGILLVDFIFQTGSAIGGNGFAIKKFETVDAATASAFACPIVVPPFGS